MAWNAIPYIPLQQNAHRSLWAWGYNALITLKLTAADRFLVSEKCWFLSFKLSKLLFCDLVLSRSCVSSACTFHKASFFLATSLSSEAVLALTAALSCTWASLTALPALCICAVISASNRLLAMPINNHVSSWVSRASSILAIWLHHIQRRVERNQLNQVFSDTDWLSYLSHLHKSFESVAKGLYDKDLMIACAWLLYASSTMLTSLRVGVKIATHWLLLPRMAWTTTLLSKWLWSAADPRIRWRSCHCNCLFEKEFALIYWHFPAKSVGIHVKIDRIAWRQDSRDFRSQNVLQQRFLYLRAIWTGVNILYLWSMDILRCQRGW